MKCETCGKDIINEDRHDIIVCDRCVKLVHLVVDYKQLELVEEALDYFINSVLMDDDAINKLADVLKQIH